MLRKVLERKGYSVIEVSDGAEGCMEYTRTNPDLVITELNIPEKNGLETLRERVEVNPRVRIIAISGDGKYFPEHFLDKAAKQGVRQLLTKPFTNQQLLTAVSQALA